MNDRFGTKFSEQDKVLEQMKADFIKKWENGQRS